MKGSRCLTFSSLSDEFAQVSRNVLYEMVRTFELSKVVLALGTKKVNKRRNVGGIRYTRIENSNLCNGEIPYHPRK